jgi:hypothetical protein
MTIGPIFLASSVLVGFWNLVFPLFRDRIIRNGMVAFLEFLLLSGGFYLYMRWFYDHDENMLDLWLIAGILHLIGIFIHLGVLLMMKGSRKKKVK